MNACIRGLIILNRSMYAFEGGKECRLTIHICVMRMF